MDTGRALLFDIGNTRIKWGILSDGELRRTGSIGHDRREPRSTTARQDEGGTTSRTTTHDEVEGYANACQPRSGRRPAPQVARIAGGATP